MTAFAPRLAHGRRGEVGASFTAAPGAPRLATLFRDHDLLLDCGVRLRDVRVAFHSYGRLNASGDNALLVLHALTGTSAVHEWWPDLLGEGRALDTATRFVVCANVLGGCAGSSGPADFGLLDLSIYDMVRVQRELLRELGVSRASVVGGSMGGMQALAWLSLYPSFLERAAVIAAPYRQSAWARGLNVAARAAIENDPAWSGGNYREQPGGLAVARQIAMLSYRSPLSLELSQGGESPACPGRPAVETYLHYQGEKLRGRFDANSYLLLTRAMDAFVVPDYVLVANRVPTLVVGVSSDVLYPAAELRLLASRLSRAEYWELHSPHGHDAFLIEGEVLGRRLRHFLRG
ncbi:homoserine O-acetyltransferase [Deinobacterium chartae]|uniref:Homoserine O-acetyltransferase n=1 Tax=Deinobacterium chartae TaxID=521158 RepID=A0A841HTD1_9DEIO|nr:homoserine O-acetyltransferase [Deinobacterium chartae]MBB6096671.1 homoserine O-acetyltransferase [Deinobacterium chartae]